MAKIDDIVNTFGVIGLKITHTADTLNTIRANSKLLGEIQINARSGIVHKQNSLGSALMGLIGESVLINALSWLDEYDSQITELRLPELKDKVKKYKELSKPVVKRIRKWTGMRQYRNIVVAHNLKKGTNGPSIFSDEVVPFKVKIPMTQSETILLIMLIELGSHLFFEVFKGEFVDKSVYLFDKIIRMYEEVDFDKEIEEIQREVIKIKNAQL